MSKTYRALQRAEAERMNGRTTPPPRAPADRDRVRGAAPWNGHPHHDQYQNIRAWIMNRGAGGERIRSLMLVAPHTASGTTTTAAMLASTLAEGKRTRVLLVDANLRGGRLGSLFDVPATGGFAEVLAEGAAFEARVRATAQPQLMLLPNGAGAHPADVFEAAALEAFVDQVCEKFDVVVFDVAPVLDFPDASLLAPHVDAIALVIEADRTSTEAAVRACQALEAAGGRVVGVILTGAHDYTPGWLQRRLRASA
jgi:capsular exopolysaccharide synthesis family protein